MTAGKPKLITFRISHYCEKARWALDWHDFDYDEVGWPPGVHIMLAKRAGAKRASVPMVIDGGQIIEGSAAIVDWAGPRASGGRAGLTPEEHREAAIEIERRLDKVIGVNVRRFIYAHVFPGRGHLLKPMLFANVSALHRLAGNLMWPVTKKLIVKSYRTDGNAAEEAREILEREFEWLEGMLGSETSYLVGDAFSRADLTAASLLAPFARPDEMPIYRDAENTAEVAAVIAEWSDRVLMRWVRRVYRQHRHWRDAG